MEPPQVPDLGPMDPEGGLALATVPAEQDLYQQVPGGLEAPFGDEDELPLGAVTEADEPAEAPKMPYLAGLDGLRGLALVAVLAFSGGLAQARGGFLGISTAFTLSGFLLAAGLLGEWAQTARIGLKDLWSRRAARIVPAVYAVIALVVVLQLTLRVGSVPTFRTDVWASLGFATNWQLMFPADGFVSSFSQLSALRHMWPVAIVVQLTLLLSLVCGGLMALTSRSWRAAGVVFAGLTAGSYATAWILGGNPAARDIVYYGTHTRAGEMLLGVVLAYLLLTPSFRSVFDRPKVLSVVRAGGPLALAGLLLGWILIPPDSSFLFRGGTLLNGLLTAWVVFAVTLPGPVTTLLSQVPLRKLGAISFSSYLLHWPVFLLIDGKRTGLDNLPLLGVRVAVTLAAGAVAVWAIESTFRWRASFSRAQLTSGLLTAAAILAVLVVILPINPPANISLTVDDGTGPGELDVVAPTGGESEAARVLVIGDETAASLMPGFAAWNEDNPDAQLRIDTHVADDCPLGGPGALRRFGEDAEPTLACEAWRYRLPKMLEAADHDVIVVLMGGADLGERQVNRTWRHLGDPAYDLWMADQITGLADVVGEPESPAVWLTYPHVRLLPEDAGDSEEPLDWADFDDNDPNRVNRLNALIQARVAPRRGFDVLDLDWWSQNQPGGQFAPESWTGSELTEQGATAAAAWLAPQLLEEAGVAPEAEEPEG